MSEPTLIHFPEWAKLARMAGRTRAKARREQRRAGSLSLFAAIACQLDASAPAPDWLVMERLADTMRTMARDTQRTRPDHVYAYGVSDE